MFLKKTAYKSAKKFPEEDQNILINMISAYGDLSDKNEVFKRLADDFLVKSFHFEELLMRIQLLVRRNNAQDKVIDDFFSIEDLNISKTDQEFFRGRQEIALT